MSFNEEASTYSGNDVSPCYSQRLALAVPVNKKTLSKYIDELIETGKCLLRRFIYDFPVDYPAQIFFSSFSLEVNKQTNILDNVLMDSCMISETRQVMKFI